MTDVRTSDAVRLYALLWAAGVELNAIAARAGAPPNVDPGYFGRLVEAIREELGGDIKPWPETFMRPILDELALSSPTEPVQRDSAPDNPRTPETS